MNLIFKNHDYTKILENKVYYLGDFYIEGYRDLDLMQNIDLWKFTNINIKYNNNKLKSKSIFVKKNKNKEIVNLTDSVILE